MLTPLGNGESNYLSIFQIVCLFFFINKNKHDNLPKILIGGPRKVDSNLLKGRGGGGV